MKTTRKILYLSFILVLIFLFGFYFTIILITGKEIDWTNLLSLGLGFLFSYAFFYFMGFRVSLKSKFAYLESDEIDEPVFGDKNERTIAIENEFLDIIEIKKEVQKKWILTHFDENNCIIKFRTKISLSSWGEGAVLKIDLENKKIKVISYPIAGYTQKGDKLSKQLIESIEKMINNVVQQRV